MKSILCPNKIEYLLSWVILKMALFDEVSSPGLALIAASPALLKVFTFFLVWISVWLPIAIPVGIALDWRPPKPLAPQQKLPLLASLYLVVPLVVWGASWVEGTSFFNYGIPTSNFSSVGRSLGLGFALAVLGLLLMFAVQKISGWVDWHWENKDRLIPLILPILLLALWISSTEELIFRGFLFQELQQDYSIGIAAAIASLIFAALHLIWEQKETLPQLPGLWLMGIVLTLAVWVDNGSLALACGLHAGWIWGLTCLDSAQLISYTGKGSQWITGLNKQPLAGAIGLVCLLGTGGILLLLLA